MTESTPSRADQIAETLRGQILSGKYEPGERLPSERELATRIGVHRSSVREALKQLEQLGMISIRPSGGARVLPLQEAGLGVLQHVLGTEAPDRALLSQWLDVHELVFAGATRLAVERATDEEIAQAKALIRKLKSSAISDEEFVVVSDELTELIAAASRNVVLQMVRNALTAQAQTRPKVRLVLGAMRKKTLPMVRDIDRALDSRDAAAAEDAIRRVMRANHSVVLDLISGPATRDKSPS